jgi:hypothetical protein
MLGLKLDWESPAAIGVRNAAERLGMTLLHAEHTPSNYDDAFGFIAREQLDGLFVARNPSPTGGPSPDLQRIDGWRRCTRRGSLPRSPA